MTKQLTKTELIEKLQNLDGEQVTIETQCCGAFPVDVYKDRDTGHITITERNCYQDCEICGVETSMLELEVDRKDRIVCLDCLNMHG